MSMRLVGEAILIICGTVCAITQRRRMPSASPAVLYTTVVAGLVVIARPGGRLFSIILPAVIALTWAVVAVARRARVALTNVLASGWRQEGRGNLATGPGQRQRN